MSDTIDQALEAARADAAVVGEILRGAREARGLTVANVAQMLKLGVRQVEAMEAGRFDLLPGPAFVRGFLRNYARLLGLDAEPLVTAVDAGAAAAGRVELAPVSNADGVMPVAGERRMSSTPVALVAFGLLVVVLAGWYFDWFRTPAPSQSEVAVPAAPDTAPQNEPLFPPPSGEEGGAPSVLVPPPAELAEPAELSAGGPPAGEAPAVPPPAAPTESAESAEPAPPAVEPAPVTPEVPPAAGEVALELRFAGESWFEVRNASGGVVATGIGNAGQVRSVRGAAPLSVVIGNATLVRLSHNGKLVDLAPHTRVSVARLTLQ